MEYVSYEMDTHGGHEYERFVCVCDLKLDFCSRCCVDYRKRNEKNKDEAEELDRLNCASRGCLNRGILTCSGCKMLRYCSKMCQVKDWKDHKKICSKKIIVNMAYEECHINRNKKDEFVEAFFVGTTLYRESDSHKKDPVLKVKAFNFGEGQYKDPKIKFDPFKYPGCDSPPTYTIKWLEENRYIQTIPCYVIHEGFQISPTSPF